MDARKFGSFVAEMRKENHMTQADLAGKINVTDKAVSRLFFCTCIIWFSWTAVVFRCG